MVNILRKSQDLYEFMESLLSEFQFDSSLKNDILAAYFDIVMEHHQSIILLTSHNLNGSASSLVRPLYETYMRFLYVCTINDENVIQNIAKDKYSFPTMHKMTIDIDKAYATEDNFFENFKKNIWSAANGYVHSGTHQLSRRLKDNMVQQSYTDEEKIEILKSVNIQLILMGIEFFKILGDFKTGIKIAEYFDQYLVKEGL
jgi:hypothetical protein